MYHEDFAVIAVTTVTRRKMATPQEIKKETELLAGLGLPRVKVWPPRCDWYTSDGELRKNMPCDP